MGRKYIVEVGRLERLYKAHINGNGMPNMTWLSPRVDLTPYTEPDMEKVNAEKDKIYDEARARGYDEGCARGYQEGLFDAWEAARKIILDKEDGGLDTVTYNEIFGYGKGVRTVLKIFTASEAIEKIQRYEQKQEEIKVGDEIVRSNGEKYVVLIVNDERKLVTILRHDGYKRTIESKWVTKTGRHFHEIAEVLAKMKESDNG